MKDNSGRVFLKGNRPMNKKYVWIVFSLSLLITLPIRIFQQLFLVEDGTGFFTDGNVTATLISAILLIGCILLVLFSHKIKEDSFLISSVQEKNYAAGVTAILTAIALLIQAINTLISVTSPELQLNAEGESVVNSSAQQPLLYAILAILGILSSFIMVIVATGHFTGKNFFKSYPLMILPLPLWGCFWLVVMFIRFTEVVNTTENAYDLFSLIFLLMFLTAYAKFLGGIEEEKSKKTVMRYGLLSTLLGLVTSIPIIIIFILKIERSEIENPFESFTLLSFSLYTFSFLWAGYHRSFLKKYKEKSFS